MKKGLRSELVSPLTAECFHCKTCSFPCLLVPSKFCGTHDNGCTLLKRDPSIAFQCELNSNQSMTSNVLYFFLCVKFNLFWFPSKAWRRRPRLLTPPSVIGFVTSKVFQNCVLGKGFTAESAFFHVVCVQCWVNVTLHATLHCNVCKLVGAVQAMLPTRNFRRLSELALKET